MRLLRPGDGCSLRVGGARQATLARSASVLELRTPPVSAAGFALVDVSLNGHQFEAATPLYYYAAPAVDSLLPPGGPIAGGTRVQLLGAGLALPASVLETMPLLLLNTSAGQLSVQATGVAADGSHLNWTAPSLPVGSYSLSLALNGQLSDAEPLGASFAVYDLYAALVAASTTPAAISSSAAALSELSTSGTLGSVEAVVLATVHPAGGPVAGGTTIMIPTAALPVEQQACCTFGGLTGTPCAAAVILRVAFGAAANGVSCVSPAASSAASALVGLSLNNGFDVVQVGNYPNPNPNRSPSTNPNLNPNPSPSPNPNPTPNPDPSPNPNLDVVQVGNFIYYEVTISALTPAIAPADGGTLITLSGTGFSAAGIPAADARCRVVGEQGGPVELLLTSLTGGVATCEALPSCNCVTATSGCTIAVGLSRNGVDAASTMALTCYPAITVTSISPTAGPLDGATSIRVEGGPFAPPSSPAAAYCRIGGHTVSATAHSAHLVCAPAPSLGATDYMAARMAQVQISLNGQDYSPSAADAPQFIYYETP